VWLASIEDVILLDAWLHMRLSGDGFEAVADNDILQEEHLRLG
jgi:hypothetical protein